jgi:potassium-transporting ATPase KdpC subunit
MNTLVIAIRTTLMTLVLTGIVYPFAVTGVAQLFFASKANGSLVKDDRGQVVGSELIGQAFHNAAYLQPRPSAAGDKGFDATSSGGSNFGVTSKKLKDRIDADVARLQKENPEAPGPVPAELFTASGSGLDPHLSPEAALWQAPRVAKARNVDVDRIRRLIEASVEARDLGFLGEPRVNVLLLNLALDRQFGRVASTTASAVPH